MSPFDAHYANVFGSRWTDLKSALLANRGRIARINAFVPNARNSVDASAPEALPGCFQSPELRPPTGSGLMPYYIMDAASVVAARSLDVQPGDRVADLCAAPGGKSLILAEALHASGELFVNDISSARRGRLKGVLRDYLPPNMLERVTLSGRDATRWGMRHPDRFNRVLLDAPCSSEAHVLNDPRALSRWTAARPRQLAFRQRALLAAAIDSAVVGGRVVYSTCALDPRENDGVVGSLLRKRAGRVRITRTDSPLGEETEFGWQILPDATGFGPIYFAVMERTAAE